MILEDAGYEVISAPDGEQALDVFSRTHVDLVLLDYTMPGIDGGVVAAPTVPLVIVSAVPVPEDVLSIADCAITKGRCADVLLNVIRSMLGELSVKLLRRCVRIGPHPEFVCRGGVFIPENCITLLYEIKAQPSA
jgi:DNA-binding response OmpR family regulator